MTRPIDESVFQELRDAILEALKPVLTMAEMQATSEQIRASEYGVSMSSEPIDSLDILEDYDMDDPTIRIEDIEVEESRRQQGIGRAIITATIEFARENGFDVNLSANPSLDFGDPEREPATRRLITYYESFGMTDEGDGNMSICLDRSPQLGRM